MVTPRVEHVYELDNATLAELRMIVAATEHLPGSCRVRARTQFGWSPHGGLLSRLHLGASTDPAPPHEGT